MHSPQPQYQSQANEQYTSSSSLQQAPIGRTVYIGNIPENVPADEIISLVRTGTIESVRFLTDKQCAFISFLDAQSATLFHTDAVIRKLSLREQEIKIGWGKPSSVPVNVQLAVQQSGATRNVYLGNLPHGTSENSLRDELNKFGQIDQIKVVPDKNIGFVHYLNMAAAIKAVQQLPLDPAWAERRVYYGKDRCAHVNKQQLSVQQQNQAILGSMGIQPMQQQVLSHMGVTYNAQTDSNFGNRTVYLGNIHPETTLEEICNVVRGGLLHHIRYIPEKHICFVTFVDPNSAIAFFGLSNMQGLLIHNRRLKIGWGKHSGPLPTQIALAVGAGASRNVYVGNIEDNLTEEQLKADFSEYGEIELVNALREKSCAFINFTNLSSAIKAIEGIKSKEGYKDRYRINFGKDRCGNASKNRTTGLPIMPTQYQPMLVMPLNTVVAPTSSSYFPKEPSTFPIDALENLRIDQPAVDTPGTASNGPSKSKSG
ncbi:protein of unknown function [Taphrina deformans PYCC 5710]|uniref:RRM domain-containing protein n=1 Tax=Taphrina deformans (strain PYCC 5710 / ATCC 11124 / CBS 356.35 / IMI 108563 / JCM 9778 / NBRC 8474) TaxID=1097556 RepID=R4XGJ5_TAPDE|nr:protein of unknown function [Taphrina deformans PYCC 5710]|eukprot:CCG84772.1 protein of unknown function [Taphrina deformans PYCC 5710]